MATAEPCVRVSVRDRSHRLLDALEYSSELVAMTDVTGTFTYANRAFLQKLCRPNEPVAGKHISSVVSQANPVTVLQELAAELAGRSNWRGECLFVSGEGDSFPVFVSVDPLKDAETTSVGSLVIAHELREEQAAAFHGAAEHFRELAENIREVFFAVTTEPLRFAYISPAYDEVWGRPRTELYQCADAWIEAVHPDDRERAIAGFRQSMQAVKTEMVYRLVRPDGSLRFIHSRTWPVFDKHGRCGKLVGIAEDITRQKDTETELRTAHDKLNLALQEAEQRTRKALQITELVDILQSCHTADEAYAIVGSMVPALVHSPSGALCITSASRNVVESVVRWGEHVACEQTFSPQNCWALRRGRVHRVDGPNSPLRCAHQTCPSPDGHVCVPLAAHGETTGVLYLQPRFPPDTSAALRQEQMSTLVRQGTIIGARVSLALANLSLREALRNQSIRDALTGLFNRRYMEESLERELRRAARNQERVALLMLDIDRFKQFNDTFGHQAGDKVLRVLGDLLLQRTRGQDLACRFGGEEFAVVLATASPEAACRRAELLQEELRNLTVHHAGEVLGKITVSIGIAVFPDDSDSAEGLVCIADQALYRAKAQGRDCIVIG